MVSRIRRYIERNAPEEWARFMRLPFGEAFDVVRTASASETLSSEQRVALGTLANDPTQPIDVRRAASLVLEGDARG